ncbi:MAG: hypothetical protein WCI73_20160, partial [Phycisphaerae bacterium]
MALNTQPLTPVRRVVMLGVLLGCFIASLGVAGGLVRWRGGQKVEAGRGGVNGGNGPVLSYTTE